MNSKTQVVEAGVIHGRFQPPHLGHMEYLLAGKSRCAFLYVGISVPDPRYMPERNHPGHRGLSSANPFTYYERLHMLRAALLDEGVQPAEFEIVPFPVDFPEYLEHYVPMDSRFFVTIYDDWGREKAALFRSMGLEVEVMWERPMKDRLTTGTEIRALMAAGRSWEHLVPPGVSSYIRKKDLES